MLMYLPPPTDSETGSINAQQLAAHLDLLFSGCSGFVPLRAFSEKGNDTAKPYLRWVACGDDLNISVLRFCEQASAKGLACYVIPGTVAERGKAGATDIQQMQCVLVDIDDGDVEAKRLFLCEHIGAPSLVVESGGVTEQGQKKLHLYWKLKEPATADHLRLLLSLRLMLAEKAGGDRHFASAHQPIRLAGSIYRKHGAVKSVHIREQSACVYELADLMSRALAMPWRDHPPPAAPHTKPTINNVLTHRVREHGVDNWTRFEGISRVIGHWLRRWHEGQITQAQAEEEIHAYNAACLSPPWPEARVQAEIERLWQKHCAEHGAPKQPTHHHVECFSARHSLQHPTPLPEDIISPRILTPGGLWLIAGPPKVGKSDFLLSLFSHAAAGLNFLCFGVSRPLRIFYAQAELEQPYLQERYRHIAAHQAMAFTPGLDNLVMTSRFHFQLDESGVEAIAKAVNQYCGNHVDIIALDPFRNIYQAGLAAGDVNAELVAFFRLRLEKLLALTNPQAGLVLVHHTNKITEKTLAEDPMAAISGGGAMLSYPSSLTVMGKAKHDDHHGITCWFDLRYGAPMPTCSFIKKDGVWQQFDQHDIRLIRQQWGQRNDEEQSRRRYNILTFLYEEALCGRLYNAESLSDTLAGRMGLGAGKTIRALIRQYETQGYIRLISNDHAPQYDLPKTRSKYGYLCVEGMHHESGDVHYLPTHYRCARSGQVFALGDDEVHCWQYDAGGAA